MTAHKDYNITNAHARDKELFFHEDTHTYIFNGEQLTSVSNVIKAFFPEFDSEAAARRKAQRLGISPELLLEQWDAKGAIAREVGTFMHDQIERTFLGLPTSDVYDFVYEGKEVRQQTRVSIAPEMAYFSSLCKHPLLHAHSIYRTEWRIYDEDHGVAGTMDCLLRSPHGRFVMIDWKRSEKIGYEYCGNFIPITSTPFSCKGLGPLSHKYDTSFVRYTLQQNLYSYILRRHYGIHVSEMYLAILCKGYNTYHLVPVPTQDAEIEGILSAHKG
ncbi:hypothetical protein [Porphyromonas sp.]|uniref:hypothetical protein n=1 Tax=Porphyromonas sp. TaxID=1924944 RepID=UPI0026DB44FD|nr:hypothetical protein [Porphyromonas sp.]MDO4770609.1 hypothetical protein [Porphyromonas sp.]